jgi:hypothetical protein
LDGLGLTRTGELKERKFIELYGYLLRTVI